jgi:hypothetical protein
VVAEIQPPPTDRQVDANAWWWDRHICLTPGLGRREKMHGLVLACGSDSCAPPGRNRVGPTCPRVRRGDRAMVAAPHPWQHAGAPFGAGWHNRRRAPGFRRGASHQPRGFGAELRAPGFRRGASRQPRASARSFLGARCLRYWARMTILAQGWA